jgi:selenium-binding protein 1
MTNPSDLDTRFRIPARVWWTVLLATATFATAALTGTAPLRAQESSKSPPHEKFLYVVATAGDGESYGAKGTSPDILAVVGTEPGSPTYGKIVHVRHMVAPGDNLHHFASSHDKRQLILLGLYSNRIYIVDLKKNPRLPAIKHVYSDLGRDSGYDMPHTALGLRDGSYLVSMMGSQPKGLEPGGMVVLGPDGRFRRAFGPPARRNGKNASHRFPRYSYDFSPRPDINRMISSSNGTAAGLRDGPWGGPGEPSPGDMYIWDYKRNRVIQRVDLGDGVGPTELRWMHDKRQRRGFVHGTNGDLWLFEDDDKNGKYRFHHLLNTGGALVDIALSRDDRRLYTSDLIRQVVEQWDVSVPMNPVRISAAVVPHSGMMRLSADDRRLYVTNGIVSSLDDGPSDRRLSPFNKRYGIYKIEIDTSGQMLPKADLFVDFDRVPLKNGRGPAGPHMILFNAAADRGHH